MQILLLILIVLFSTGSFADVICNTKSKSTNLREGPSAKNFAVSATLINGEVVEVLERITNAEGFEYLKVRFKNKSDGREKEAFVYHEAVDESCSILPTNEVKPKWIPVTSNAPVLLKGNFPKIPFTRAISSIEITHQLCPREGMPCGIVGRDGLWVIEPNFDNTSAFSEGVAGIKLGGKWGYIDSQGDWIVEPKFDDVWPFSQGLGLVRIGNLFGYVNSSGKWLVEPKFDSAESFSDGMAAVKDWGKYGYINLTGEWIIDNIYDYAVHFSEGLAAVKLNEKYGFIDKTGKLIVDYKFADAFYFKEGLAFAKIDDKYGFIDNLGAWAIEPKFESVSSFREGVAKAKLQGKFGFINRVGTFVIEPKFETTGSFKEGLAYADSEGKFGYINSSGTWLIEPKFDDANSFLDGIALVGFGNRKGYIDKSGKPLSFTPEDFMLGTIEGNQKRMEAELATKQEEIERLRKEAEAAKAQSKQIPQETNVSNYKFSLGDGVSYNGHSNKSGWEGVIEDRADERYRVKILRVNLNGFLALSLDPDSCTGNERLEYGSEGTRIWVSKWCVE